MTYCASCHRMFYGDTDENLCPNCIAACNYSINNPTIMDIMIQGAKKGVEIGKSMLKNYGAIVQDGLLDDPDMVGDAIRDGFNAKNCETQVPFFMERNPGMTKEEACFESYYRDGLICDSAYERIKKQKLREKELKQQQEEEEYNLQVKPYIDDFDNAINKRRITNEANREFYNQIGYSNDVEEYLGGGYDDNNEGGYNNPYENCVYDNDNDGDEYYDDE
ncbi:hypothetical protein BCR32DRAFT_306530 [Anaeromyces robustus]|uniref:Uncharacterized protein n=1 Tax=Anaeromyces robustus TaxID=1754192 RepID=A0A1Y1XQP0_9FUNG|nr:hypothetical protein BCR32DRAFT_306530 [Anaeromyces robustus]|eukprot:ORX87816.1 hypothetical protein BCR32DRAFT_306530 [Anaeromyces robustus]